MFVCYTAAMKKFLLALTFTVFVFGFAGWIYIAENAVNHPETLPLQLTHLAPYPHEDTFGVICFALSFVALFSYRYLRETDRK
jgi:hypothetical protein